MNKLCLFYKNIAKIGVENEYLINIISSFSIMFTWVILAYILLRSKIEYWYEFLYFMTAIPLSLYTIITHQEPKIIVHIFAILIWIIIMLLPLFFKEMENFCIFQNVYSLSNVLFGVIVLLGKTF